VLSNLTPSIGGGGIPNTRWGVMYHQTIPTRMGVVVTSIPMVGETRVFGNTPLMENMFFPYTPQMENKILSNYFNPRLSNDLRRFLTGGMVQNTIGKIGG